MSDKTLIEWNTDVGTRFLTIHPDGSFDIDKDAPPLFVIGELAKAFIRQQDRIKRLEEFVDQLTNPKFTREDLPKEALLQRIKLLEEAGDALKAAGYFGGFNDAVNKWVKVKEEKP